MSSTHTLDPAPLAVVHDPESYRVNHHHDSLLEESPYRYNLQLFL